jgi:transcriptional regulator PpsR
MSGSAVSQPDVTLLLDLDGIIRRATLSDGLPSEASETWIGQSWADTVSEEASEKVASMLQDARTTGVCAYRMVYQRFPNGLELPVEYSTIMLGDSSGLIAIGKNQQTVADLQNRLIAAQQAREQDYWKLREVETRYRLLFETSNEVVLVVRADGLRIVEANLAALRSLSLAPGQDLVSELQPTEQELFRTMLTRVRQQGRAPGIVVHLGVERAAWTMRASLIANEAQDVFLLQLAPMAGAVSVPTPNSTSRGSRSDRNSLPIDDLMERVPDAFVVIDHSGVILRANPAFLDLAQMGGEGSVIGEKLARWLSRPGADLAVLLSTVRRHRYVRLFATTLQGELSSEVEVEISAAGSSENQPRYIGLLIRDVSRRVLQGANAVASAIPTISTGGNTLLAALGAMADDLGQTSLPTLIKQTVGLVEKHFIEAALERSDGNRTATAELLGLSRQSLYLKLNRYGLDGSGQAVVDNES